MVKMGHCKVANKAGGADTKCGECRGYATRQRLKRDPQLDAAAAHIQNVWRRHQGRKSGLLRIRKMQQARDTRFLHLQDSLVRCAHVMPLPAESVLTLPQT